MRISDWSSDVCSSDLSGMDRVMVAGGTQSSSTMPRTKRRVPGSDDVVDWFSPTHPDSPEAPNMDMSITVGWNAAVKANVTREEMDAWALRSHQRDRKSTRLNSSH